MKKVVLVLAVLMLAVPAMAGITIGVAQIGASPGVGVVEVNYVRTGGDDVNIPRAFALDVRMSPANGSSLIPTNFDPNFYVAPGTFAYNSDTNTVITWGTRYVGPNTVGFTTEMGSLWGPNDPCGHTVRPLSKSGTLFRFTVDKTCDITITQNAIRGGVVMENTTKTFAPSYVTITPTPLHVVVPGGCDPVPNVLGMDRVAARAAIIAAGYVANEVNGPPTVTYTTLRTVSATKPVAGSTPGCGSTVDFNAVSYPIKTMTVANSLYVNWQLRGRPACWAYPRQCHGDANGMKLGAIWVSGNDLTILKGAINKALTAIPAGGICADFDHKPLGAVWVSGNDLTILKAYINKAESLVPVCGNVNVIPSADPNNWYWCIPVSSPATLCPTGQKCAPAGICPNSL